MKQLNWYQIFGNTHTIPDGRTVTPTDDIQIWLNCADIWDKSYTTLYEVLNDTATLSALMASDNAVDYLVRSTSWAVATALVPAMTSDTEPSGICLCDSNVSGENAYKAFDKNNSTWWSSNVASTTGGQWIGYKFTSPQIVSYLINRSSAGATNYVKVQYSDDDVNWVDTGDTYNIKNSDGDKKVSLTVDSAHYSYRIYCTSASSTTRLSTTELNFYSPSISESADAMTYIGQNNYCANTLLADATWCNAIVESEYWESVLSPLVPEMTSNTTPSGIASQYGTPSGSAFEAYKAFDRSNTTHAEATFTRNDTWHVRYEFPTAVKCYVGKYIAHNPSSATYSFSMKMQRSADGVTWTDISGSTTQSISGGNTYSSGKIIFTSFDDAKYYQFCSQPNNYYAAGATEVQFYGRKDI